MSLDVTHAQTMSRSWRAFAASLAVMAVLAGCTKVGEPTRGAAPEAATAKRPANSMLAYEHDFSIVLEPDEIASRFEAVRAACLQAERNACTLLNAELSAGDHTQAKIVARTEPAFVSRLVELASKGGEIESQSTRAEDLTAPVTDTERNLAWLTKHRDRLIAFQDRPDIKVEQLIQLSEQIARTQGEIENLTAARGQLQRRIDTDLVTIALRAPWSAQRSVTAPVREAAADFVPNFFLALGALMQFVSFLLPWLIILVPLVLGVRWSWRRFRRSRAAG